MKDCRVMNIGAVEGEAQSLGDHDMVEYVGWGGGVIGNIRSVEEEKPEWEPIGGRMTIEPILGDIDEVERHRGSHTFFGKRTSQPGGRRRQRGTKSRW